MVMLPASGSLKRTVAILSITRARFPATHLSPGLAEEIQFFKPIRLLVANRLFKGDFAEST